LDSDPHQSVIKLGYNGVESFLLTYLFRYYTLGPAVTPGDVQKLAWPTHYEYFSIVVGETTAKQSGVVNKNGRSDPKLERFAQATLMNIAHGIPRLKAAAATARTAEWETVGLVRHR